MVVDSSFSVFHNNIISSHRNLENLQTRRLYELNFHFNISRILETKITNANTQFCLAKVPGYTFEPVPTPLASGGGGGVEMFIDESLKCHILEKTSNEAVQAFWGEIPFDNKKNIICGILYRQHNSPDHAFNYILMRVSKSLHPLGNTL